jgi:hypothetical protein
MDVVREKLLKECQRPSFAESVQYRKPMGSKFDSKTGQWEEKHVTGPSIRFAEAAIRCMGNIVVQEVTTYDDEEKRIIEVSVTDLESNTVFPSSITIEKTVERRKKKDGDEVIRERLNSHGEKVYILRATEDELLNKKNALLSKAIRTNGMRLIPGDIVDECMWTALQTTKNQDAKDPDAARLKIIDAFSALNVSVADLKKYVGDDLGRLSPKDLADLRALHSAIKDGETSWRAAMEAKHPTESLADKMKADLGGGTPSPAAASTTTKAPTPAETLKAFIRAADATSTEQAGEVVAKICGQATEAEKVPAAKRAEVIQALNVLAGVA